MIYGLIINYVLVVFHQCVTIVNPKYGHDFPNTKLGK